jgi:hypothetical protein
VTDWRRFAIAGAVSAAAHAAVFALGDIDLSERPAELPPLAVSIEHVAPAPRAPARTPRRAARSAAPRAPALPVIAPRDVEHGEVAIAESEIAPAVEVAPPAAESERVVVATAPPSTLSPAAPALPTFPRSGRITFDIVYGRDRFPVARTVQSWKIDGARYQLASRSETTGIIDVFRSQHRTYLSRGELTPEGFKPETFLMSRDRGRGTEEARAQFDWARAAVTLGPAAAQRQETLPQGAQDLVSFIYQLALDPPAPGTRRVSVTNGTRLDTYVLQVMPEEKIETPLGVLRALPIRQVRSPGEESVDLWLATEYRYLPVRIRFYDRDGEPQGEQIVTGIHLSDE